MSAKTIQQKTISIIGYVLVVPYSFFQPVLTLPRVMVPPSDPAYATHVIATFIAMLFHAAILHIILIAAKRRIPFGTSLFIAIAINLILRMIIYLYAIISL